MLLIFLSVTKNSTPVTPAPTAASVMARSGDLSNAQMIDIITL